ncbi:cytochrome P450 [Russula compacta]|nr:cytochrome P450 [Russula compacta]
MPLSLVTVADFLAVFVFVYLLLALRDHQRRRGHPYPPGPPCWPVIGNLLDVPKLSPWIAYADISKQHAIKELLEKRGELMEVDWTLPILRKGEYWRKNRRLLDRSLRPGAAALHRRMIEEKTRAFLGQLLTTPNDFRAHIDFLQGKIIMSLTYGYELKENDDILEPVHKTVRHTPSWIPLFKYEPIAGICRELSHRMMNEPIDFVKKTMQEGTAVASLASEHLQEAEKLSGPERQREEKAIKETLGSLFQEVQKRAQAELDSVVSRDRLPSFEDKPRLPYIEAMCRELIRWQMVTPMGTASLPQQCELRALTTTKGVPHASTEDDVYRGFFIPKGSLVLANAWAVLHDPDLYPDPEAFKPERFLRVDGTFRDDPTIALAFGVGKRICPGRHLVDATLFFFVSAKDENGRDIPVKIETLVEGMITLECMGLRSRSTCPGCQVAEALGYLQGHAIDYD